MRRLFSPHLLAITLSAALSTAASAALTTFTDQADFFSAIQGAPSYTEDFDNLESGSEAATRSDDHFSYTLEPASGGLWRESIVKLGSYSISTIQHTSLTVTFTGDPVYAIGGYFAPIDDDSSIMNTHLLFRVNFDEFTYEEFSVIYPSGADIANTFFGFIADRPITSLVLIPEAGAPIIDELTVASIPEPAGWALLSLGALAVLRKRKPL